MVAVNKQQYVTLLGRKLLVRCQPAANILWGVFALACMVWRSWLAWRCRSVVGSRHKKMSGPIGPAQGTLMPWE